VVVNENNTKLAIKYMNNVLDHRNVKHVYGKV